LKENAYKKNPHTHTHRITLQSSTDVQYWQMLFRNLKQFSAICKPGIKHT